MSEWGLLALFAWFHGEKVGGGLIVASLLPSLRWIWGGPLSCTIVLPRL